MIPKPVVLVILDGWGLSSETEGNAILQARTPFMEQALARYPHTILGASGEDVGLLSGQMGNSNVGHLNLGAGRIVYQDSLRIDRSIREGSFFKNPVILGAVDRARQRGKKLHLMGLVSDGGVHSHIHHLKALLKLAHKKGIREVFVHCFTDGRDVSPTSAGQYIDDLETYLGWLGTGRVATVMGRYYSMDRDQRWERTAKAFQAMVLGKGYQVGSAREAVVNSYARGDTDEFIEPSVVMENGRPVGLVEPGDSVIFFNFRPDRARQITRAFTDGSFAGLNLPTRLDGVHFVGLVRYDEDFHVPYAFPPVTIDNTLGEVVSNLGYTQLRIAETEKYAHVTYFFSGGKEEPLPGEKRRMIPSPKVPTYDQQPEMSAPEVTRAVVEEIRSGKHDVIVLNFANADMVGHTGQMEAVIRAIEVVDRCLGIVVREVEGYGGVALVVGDHGNAEEMFEPGSQEPHTAHTSNPVPCLLAGNGFSGVRLRNGILADVAPTMLELMGLAKPVAMEGRSLLVR